MFILEEGQCTQCGACVEICPCKALELVDDKLEHYKDNCIWCGHCLAVCPCDAIMIDGDGYDIEDVEEFNLLTRPTPQQIRRQIMMRRSVRIFNDEEVTDAELSFILEAAKYSPTSYNSQDNMLLVITTAGGRTELFEKNPDINFYNAPVIICVFSGKEIDGAICAETMMQMVGAQQGLGACYIQAAADAFNSSEDLKKAYEIPSDKKCIIAIAVGHTDLEFFSSVPRKEVPIIWR